MIVFAAVIALIALGLSIYSYVLIRAAHRAIERARATINATRVASGLPRVP